MPYKASLTHRRHATVHSQDNLCWSLIRLCVVVLLISYILKNCHRSVTVELITFVKLELFRAYLKECLHLLKAFW